MTTPLPPFLGEEARTDFERARVAVLPVPYEATVSYGAGTARGPEAILRASTQVELYDDQLAAAPYREGIWTDPPLALPAGAPQRAMEAIARRCGELLGAGKWLVMLGGEHSITPAAVRATAALHRGLHVVQLDAHADLREAYEGDPLSHACAMARCLEHAAVRAIGIRSYSAEEAERLRGGLAGYDVIHAWEMQSPGWQQRALKGLDGKPVYLTIDLDFFDPSLIPATGTPEPGGGAWWPTLGFLESLFDQANVVAADVVELAPIDGLAHPDFAAARLVHKLAAWSLGFRSRRA
ncbi:MAG TPA: agmatinase [Candidatus Polarisedimenticolaceae bacterium]|nr:agmatinase [Candidatus Polarisedimenticolaceae bacterium]